MFDNSELCSACGGKCCKNCPGSAFPIDFGLEQGKPPDFSKLSAALNSGRWCIDWWEGDPRPTCEQTNKLPQAYYVRPAAKGHEGKIRHGTWGNIPCTFLSITGCTLASADRPLQCKMLEPRPAWHSVEAPGTHCELHGDTDKQAGAIVWIPYWEFLDNFRQKEI